MLNPFAEAILENETFRNSKHHLSFAEACGYYAALKCEGVTNTMVECAAGLKQPTVSALRHAGEVYAGCMRYPKIAREYEKLGHDAFVTKYLTAEIKDRILVAMSEPKKTLRASGFVRRRASGLIGTHWLKPRNQWQAEWNKIRIERRDDGYYSVFLRWDTTPADREDRLEPIGGPFQTGEECYRHARDKLTPKHLEPLDTPHNISNISTR